MNFNENRKIMMVVTTCLILSVWLPSVSASRKVISSQTGAPKEVKPKYAMKLCGKDFIQAWKNICKLKQSKQNARGRKRRSLTGKEIFFEFYVRINFELMIGRRNYLYIFPVKIFVLIIIINNNNNYKNFA